MSSTGVEDNNKGFTDSKSFRTRVLQTTNERLGVIVRTLSEGNGTATDKENGLLSRLDSNYKSDIPSTKYAMHLKAIAFESAKFIISSNDYTQDLYFVDTQGEYLYQNVGSFLFPNQQLPQTDKTDVQVRSLYLSLIQAYFSGATKASIEKALYTYTGVPVAVSENFELSKSNASLDSVVNQFVFNVNIDTSDDRIRDVNSFQKDINFLLNLIKPAHTSYQTSFVYSEQVESVTKLSESFNLDQYVYYYEDLRKVNSILYPGSGYIPLENSYKYKGFDTFNTSILNDPQSLNYNELGTRDKLNDSYTFKSFGYDLGKYTTTLQEKSTIVPASLNKSDVWSRLPFQEFRLDNTEFIMNNMEDRLFGEIHYPSYPSFFSALEVDSINNGGSGGIISTLYDELISIVLT